MTKEDDRARYIAAIERYAEDEEFRARVLGIRDLIMRAEGNQPTPESQVGMWIGIAVALHLGASVDKCPDCLVLVEHDDLATHRLMIHPWEE
jgi:hypothetical protein